MIPALYFVLRLFQHTLGRRGPWARQRAAAIVAAVLVLPLMMKSLPAWARGSALNVMATTGVVDASSESSVSNARAALGLTARSAPSTTRRTACATGSRRTRPGRADPHRTRTT
jgi:hypothetical protein